MGGVVPEGPKIKEVCLSLGSNLKVKEWIRYGIVHIMWEYFAQLKVLWFDTVEAYIKHVLTHIHKAVLEKKRESGVSYFVVTEPFPSQKHPDKNSMDSLIVTLYNKSDHWEIINTWHTSADYIKRKEQEPSVPTVGLPYATDKAEVRPGETVKGSDSAYAAGTLNLSLSDDKDTKKSEQSDVPLTKQNKFGAEEKVQKELTLTDYKGKSVTLQLSDEKDHNGKPYVLTSDGKLSYGVIPGGLVPEEPKTKDVRLSLGSDVREEGTYRYGLVHIMEDHYAQLKKLGFETVEEFIKHVLSNIGGAVLDKIYEGKTTHFVFTIPFNSKSHPNRKKQTFSLWRCQMEATIGTLSIHGVRGKGI